ncbi:MAG: hypothetical protein CM15mP109_06340 [Candidatus Dadabacteria bacterium]|nr:MAG: hypothetical protein CM15mP109_06340 [Candidatus Dadabacteria bacterium]
MEEKTKILKNCLENETLLFLQHDPYNELVSLTNTDKGVRLENSSSLNDFFFVMKPLKGNKNVEVLFSSGKRVSSSFLHCVYLLNKEDSRFVVSVPKKNFSLAVDRNKIKRFLREAVRKHSKEVLSFGGGWFMFIYSSDKVVSFLDIEKDFKLLVKNIS